MGPVSPGRGHSRRGAGQHGCGGRRLRLYRPARGPADRPGRTQRGRCRRPEARGGCSTRNGGQISHSVKPGHGELTRRYGEATARRILADGRQSRSFIEKFVTDENLDCAFAPCGRFHAALSARGFEKLRHDAENQPAGFETRVTVVGRDAQREEIGSGLYHGGVVFHEHASIDPGRYHAGLLDLVRHAGATMLPLTRVTRISTGDAGAKVETARGTISTRDVVLATNGYTDAVSGWHRRRIIPIGSYVIATEELPQALVDELDPKGRVFSDTRKVVYYYRSSPDRRRIVFGGRVSAAESDTATSAKRLHAEMVRIFPQLESCRISHSWMGLVGYTFDTLAHVGRKDGVYHAMGYCGSGVGMASYLGMKTGRAVLGQADAATGLGETDFPTRPFYSGKPWFLPAAVQFYRLRDRLGL
ncbi:MAG: FAD-binding oxidoreductase [Geminicoccaceae bacterium]